LEATANWHKLTVDLLIVFFSVSADNV